MRSNSPSMVVGVLLAGGLSRRMGGGDKCLQLFGNTTLLGRAIDRAQPQVSDLILNANGEPHRFDNFGLQVVSDAIPGFAGPLAGVLTGMEWALSYRPDAHWIATFATDAPFFPHNLVHQFIDNVHKTNSDLARATSGGRPHPVFGLWPVHLAKRLRQALTIESIRKIDVWTSRYRTCDVDFMTEPIDPFFNVNISTDLEKGRAMLTKKSMT